MMGRITHCGRSCFKWRDLRLGVCQFRLRGIQPSLRRSDGLLVGLSLRSQIGDLGSGGLDFGLKTSPFILQVRHDKYSYCEPDSHVRAWIATRKGFCRVMDAICAEFLPHGT